MLILSDFSISLSIDIACCNQNTELAVTETGNKTGHVFNPDAVAGAVTFSFQCEIDKNSRDTAANPELTDGIPSAISGWSGKIYGCYIRQEQPCECRNAWLKPVMI